MYPVSVLRIVARAQLCFWLSLCLSLYLTLWSPLRAAAAELAIHFFDIGQGDASLVVSPTGKRVLIDGGPPEGTDALLAGLRRRGIDRIDLILLSHPHLDHLGGLRRVIEQLPVGMFMDAGYPSTSPPYTALLKALAARGVPVKQATLGRSIDLGDGAALLLLSPPSPWLANTRSDVNANSVVARLTWRGRSALFAGDAEPEAEAWLLQQYRDKPALLAAEVLKVPHHGGKYSSTAAFVLGVKPRWAVISVAAVNDYHHPTPEAMGRLRQVGAQLLRTDELGTITLRSRDGEPWQIETERGSAAGAPVAAGSPVAPHPSPPPAPAGNAKGAAPASSAEGYLGSRRSPVFHRAHCPAAQQIVPGNLLRFPTRDEALASGRRPAEDCHP